MRTLVERLESRYGGTDLHEMGKSTGFNSFVQFQNLVDLKAALAMAIRVKGDVTEIMDTWNSKSSHGNTLAKMLPSVLSGKAHQVGQIAKELELASKKAAVHAKTFPRR
jgi:hypothetical protein